MLKMIILILSLALTGCGGDKPFPLEYVYVVDIPHSVCAKKQIVDQEKLIFKHVEDLPLIACDGNVSVAKDDFPALNKWIIWAVEKAHECQTNLKEFLGINAKLSNDNISI